MRFTSVAACCAMSFAVVHCASAEIPVGADFGVSGNVARYGEWALRGAQLAVDEVNQRGGVHGEQLKLILEDNQGSAAGAVSAFQKLTSLDHVRFILTYQSSIALAVSPLANRAGVVQMDVSAITPSYSTPHDYTFRTGVLAPQLFSKVAEHLSGGLNIGQVALLYIENEMGEAGRKSFKEAYKGKVIFEESFPQNAQDFRPLLPRLRSSEASALVLVSHIRESALFVKQAAAGGLRLKIYSDVYSIEAPDLLELAGITAEGVVYASPGVSDAAVGRVLQARYTERFHEEPTYFAAQAYDGVLALAEALGRCANAEPACVKDALYKIDIEGASGRIVFDEYGDIHGKPVQLKTVRNGKFEPL